VTEEGSTLEGNDGVTGDSEAGEKDGAVGEKDADVGENPAFALVPVTLFGWEKTWGKERVDNENGGKRALALGFDAEALEPMGCSPAFPPIPAPAPEGGDAPEFTPPCSNDGNEGTRDSARCGDTETAESGEGGMNVGCPCPCP
jgi:hypothetical protein